MKSMKMIQNAQRGFTLIELMIVVAIIGILAAIAIPQYQDYVLKSRWASAVSSIDGIKKSAYLCLADRGNNGTQCDEIAELQLYGYSGTAFPTPTGSNIVTVVGTDTVAGAPPTPGFVTITVPGQAQLGTMSYVAACGMAAANGNMSCTSTAADTLTARTGYTPGAAQIR